MTLVRSVENYVEQISQSWHQTVDAILSTAALCAEANSTLSKELKQQLLKRLPFEEPHFASSPVLEHIRISARLL